MKNLKLLKSLALIIIVAGFALTSCGKKDNPAQPNIASGTTVISGVLHGNIHWTADQHYLLKNYVYVDSGSVLTIDAGTVIKGDKASKGALIIEKGAQIIAVGTPSNPIVFTSNQPAGSRNYGDWGGVILCGRAPNNWQAAKRNDGTTGTLPIGIGQVEGGPRSLYGGTHPEDNSGTLQYVRIEFGGVAFSPNNEVNGLTLCSVGYGTTIDHIQVSYSGDDSYEWFGGTVNCKNLICHRGWDDDFDTDNGYSGNVQFGMILRDPSAADYSGSHTFESDSRNEDKTSTPLTAAVYSNITAVGPLLNPSSTNYNPNFVCGAILRRASSLSIMNSAIIGYPSGLIVEDDDNYGKVTDNINAGNCQVANTAFIGMPPITLDASNHPLQADFLYRINDVHSSPNAITGSADTTTNTPFGTYSGPWNWAIANACGVYKTEGTSSKLYNGFSLTAPDFVPTTTSIFVTVPPASAPKFPASFTSTKFSNAFFDKTATYVGGFSGDATANWAQGWTNFDPQSTNYGSAY